MIFNIDKEEIMTYMGGYNGKFKKDKFISMNVYPKISFLVEVNNVKICWSSII